MSPAHQLTSQAASSSIVDVMQRLGLRSRFSKDEEIFAQEEEADLVYLVVSGVVRTSRVLADGRRQIGDFHYAGDLVGLEGGTHHRDSAEAICDTEVLVVRRTALKTFAGDGELDRAVWEATRRELDRAQEHIVTLGRKSASERVASFLIDLAERGSRDRVEMPMSRQDVADYLGLTIETVSRMLTQLQSACVVKFESCRRFKVTSWSALQDMAA